MKNNINEIVKNIEKITKDLAEQKELLAKLKKEDYEIGDEIQWCGIDWIFIGYIEDKELKLMAKDIVAEMTYSNNNSNDYFESNVREFLETEFINRLDKDKLLSMVTNYDEEEKYLGCIRIPTLREIETLPMNIRSCNNPYWTMTSLYSLSEDCNYANVFSVYSSGFLYYNDYVTNANGVRPVIVLDAETLL